MLSVFGVSRLEGDERDGIHLLWSPPYPTGHSLDGYTLRRRRALGGSQPICVDVDGSVLANLHRYGHERLPSAEAWARAWVRTSSPVVTTHTPQTVHGWTYRFDLDARHYAIEIKALGQPRYAYAARARDGQIVDVQPFTEGTCYLRGADIGRVWIAAASKLESAWICGQSDAGDWSDAEVLADGLQLPIRAVDPRLDGLASELAQARGRLLSGESLDGDFDLLSVCMNSALTRPYQQPAWHVATASPTRLAESFDVSALGHALALTLWPTWRRVFGLGWLDHAKHLRAGESYDYRLDATVPLIDHHERRLDFHTVPRGFQLPMAFRMGPAMVYCDRAPVVEHFGAAIASEFSPLFKGVRFRHLNLAFDAPLVALVLHGAAARIEWRALNLSDSTVQDGTTALGERTELRFDTPITSLRLIGEGTFAGISYDPIPAHADPNDSVKVFATAMGVRFEATPRPAAPMGFGATALTGRGAHAGFELSWLPPDHLHAAAELYWPEDATSAPPSAINWYELERCEGTSGSYTRLRDELSVSARNVDPAHEWPQLGFDVYECFPPHDRGGEPRGMRVRVRDVFDQNTDSEIPWGKEFSYRVRAVDVLGRESAPAMFGPITLEKRRRPPPPGSPSWLRGQPGPSEPRKPAGVQVRLIERPQPDEPALSEADAALLGDAEAVAELYWGWGAKEREQDSEVTEFRVYVAAERWHTDPEHWDERVAIVPLHAAIDHPAVIPLHWLEPDVARVRRVGWIGVTACDSEGYVVDRRVALETSPRSGNESNVAVVEIVRRHRRRPELVPEALGEVATITLPRFEGKELRVRLRPADHGSVPAGRLRVERCTSGPLLRSLVLTDAGVSLRRADGSSLAWRLPAAESERLRTQLSGGQRIDDLFLPHIAAALGTEIDGAFVPIGDIDAGGLVDHALPNHRERHVYRVRTLAGSIPSRAAQVLPAVFEIPSYSEPPMPEIDRLEAITIDADAGARVRVRYRGEARDHVLLFHGVDPRAQLPTVEFAWIRNRADLMPMNAAVVRDDRGHRLTGTELHMSVRGPGERESVAEHSLVIPPNTRLHVWALAVSHAGVPSRLIGPQFLTNGHPRES